MNPFLHKNPFFNQTTQSIMESSNFSHINLSTKHEYTFKIIQLTSNHIDKHILNYFPQKPQNRIGCREIWSGDIDNLPSPCSP
jgi:hypothetical protein